MEPARLGVVAIEVLMLFGVAVQRAGEHVLDDRRVIGHDVERVDRLAGNPEHRRGRFVGVENFTLAVDDDHSGRRPVEDRSKLRFGTQQGLLGGGLREPCLQTRTLRFECRAFRHGALALVRKAADTHRRQREHHGKLEADAAERACQQLRAAALRLGDHGCG